MAEKTVGTLQLSIEQRAAELARVEAQDCVNALRATYNRVKNDPSFRFVNTYRAIHVSELKDNPGYYEALIPFSQFLQTLESNLREWLLEKHVDEQTSRLLNLVDQVQDIANQQEEQ